MALFFGIVLDAWALDPFDNIARAQGAYLMLYPQYARATRMMDKDGNTLPTKPDATLYQNLFKLLYIDKTLLPNATVVSASIPIGYSEMFGDHDFGIGDLSLLAGYWFLDDAASKTWFGGKMTVVVPVGSYDAKRKANMGANVWKFQPVLFAAKHLGKFQVELAVKFTAYTQNPDTSVRTGNDVAVETYTGYYLSPSLLVGGHFNASLGWDKTVHGSAVPDSGIRKFQAGPSVFKRFGGRTSVMVEALSDFGVKNSTEGYTVCGRFIRRF
jgi:hypothetical protein